MTYHPPDPNLTSEQRQVAQFQQFCASEDYVDAGGDIAELRAESGDNVSGVTYHPPDPTLTSEQRQLAQWQLFGALIARGQLLILPIHCSPDPADPTQPARPLAAIVIDEEYLAAGERSGVLPEVWLELAGWLRESASMLEGYIAPDDASGLFDSGEQ